MGNEEHLAILRQGVEVWNQWRRNNPDTHPELSEANLINADLYKPNLRWADLTRSNLSGANLVFANLIQANLRGADLRGALLKSAQLYQADLSGVKLNNTKINQADLREANFNDAILCGADLSGADLLGVNFNKADLSGANLKGASLENAHLVSADLSGSDLSTAELIQTGITGAKFIRTRLAKTIFDNTEIGHTILADIDLSQATGLETVKHWGPSYIGVDTIIKSNGKIPEVFLRGTGITDNFIEYLPSLLGKAIQFYSCFISYSTKDEEFAKRLYADLQANAVRCWFAPEDIQGGRKLYEQIPEAIRLYDKLLLVLSENSMNSEWVKTEIYHARQDEVRNNERKLFPIGLVGFDKIRKWEAFDADIGKDMAREIREYFIPDFSNWKDHEDYKKAFERLLRDLKAIEPPANSVTEENG